MMLESPVQGKPARRVWREAFWKRATKYLAGCLPYLWRTVKYEEVYLHDYLSPREARQALTRYFAFYNQERLHQALDYQTPAEVYFSVPPSVSRLSDVHEECEFVLAPDVVESTREQASEERRHL